MDAIFQYGLSGVIAFGGVGVISYLLEKYAKTKLESEVKLGLLAVIFFLVGYVPTDFGDDLLNRIKVAVGGALAIHALWSVKRG